MIDRLTKDFFVFLFLGPFTLFLKTFKDCFFRSSLDHRLQTFLIVLVKNLFFMAFGIHLFLESVLSE